MDGTRTLHLFFDFRNTTAVLTKKSLAPQDKLKTSSFTEDRQGFHLHTSGVEPRDLPWGPRVPDRGYTTKPSSLGWTWHFFLVWSLLLLGHSQKNKIQNWGAVGRVMNTHVLRPLAHNMMFGIDLPSTMTFALTSSVFGSVWSSQCLKHSWTGVFVTSKEDVTGNSAMILHSSTNHKQEGEDPKPRKKERRRRKQK